MSNPHMKSLTPKKIQSPESAHPVQHSHKPLTKAERAKTNVRIRRVLEYHGPASWIDDTLSRSAIQPGVVARMPCGATITEITRLEFAERAPVPFSPAVLPSDFTPRTTLTNRLPVRTRTDVVGEVDDNV